MWQQRRFWGRRRDWTSPKKRKPRKIELSARGIYEPVELEESVLKKIHALLWYSGIPCFRARERIPVCHACGAFVAKPSDAGHPDLSGWIPPGKIAGRLWPIPYYLETKRPKGGVHRAAQVEFIKRAQRDGVIAEFVHSYEECRDIFKALGIILPDG